jgi:DNA polymerase I-like protein with 3'-5' exonuclease and polymerase domains
MDSKYDGEYIESLYGRKIKSDSFHSLNYLVQSSTAELVLDQIIKINKILQNKKSFISFIVHDSVVIDLDKEDKNMVQELVDTFSKTKLGNFPVNISMGKDYGNLRKVKC